jgi:hypothetical protein
MTEVVLSFNLLDAELLVIFKGLVLFESPGAGRT